jgi:hypothetical protein
MTGVQTTLTQQTAHQVLGNSIVTVYNQRQLDYISVHCCTISQTLILISNFSRDQKFCPTQGIMSMKLEWNFDGILDTAHS